VFSRLLLCVALGLTAVAVSSGCGVLAAVAGGTGSCDRREATKEPRPFCQEIVDTVAVSQFGDDCKGKHTGYFTEDACPRDKAIGGCELDETNDDGSTVVDWFYDVSAEPKLKEYPPEDVAHTTDDVKRFCADKKRYEKGAHFRAR
jgi:hypothetical protein